jgi:hypothetical protein
LIARRESARIRNTCEGWDKKTCEKQTNVAEPGKGSRKYGVNSSSGRGVHTNLFTSILRSAQVSSGLHLVACDDASVKRRMRLATIADATAHHAAAVEHPPQTRAEAFKSWALSLQSSTLSSSSGSWRSHHHIRRRSAQVSSAATWMSAEVLAAW